jgi:trimeric autotransporter adhesin
VNSIASSTQSVALGARATASGLVSTALGSNSVASGVSSTAVGDGAHALAPLSTALGQNATVLLGATNSVALGQGSVADRANTVSVGSVGNERIIANVAPGVLGTDAVNVNQLNSAFSSLSTSISNVQTEERRGIAAAMAATEVITPLRPGGTTVSVAGGFFENQAGIGISFAHRFAAAPNLVFFGSYGNSGPQNVGRVGGAWEF